MALKFEVSIEDIDSLDENVKTLYKETDDGKFVLDVEDAKPLSEFNKVHDALQKERNDHKSVKQRLSSYGDATPDEILKLHDKIAELEAMGAGKGTSTEKLEEILKARVTPYIREKEQALQAMQEAVKAKDQMLQQMRSNQREQEVLKSASSLIKSEFLDDVLLRAQYQLKYNDETQTFVDENGAGIAEWVSIQTTKTPSWLNDSQGAGAHGGSGNFAGAKNPFIRGTHYNVTEQGRLLREQPTLAAKYMKQAGLE